LELRLQKGRIEMAEIIKDKYIVIKTEDAEKYLDDFERHQLELALESIVKGRESDGKIINTYYLCNTDEPYSDKVLQVILGGEDAKNGTLKPSGRTCENCTRWDQ